MNSNIERLTAEEGSDATVTRGTGLVEQAEAHGEFYFSCVGPVERLRGLHISLSTRIRELTEYAQVDHQLIILDLHKRLLDIPLEVKWEGQVINHVMTEGKNLMLDTALGTGISVVGPYMGLISSVGYTTTAIGDTAAQINGTNGWKEAGSGINYPLYTTPRKTCVWSAAAAGAKTLSAPLTFPIITTGGTVKGCFVITGAGASSSIADVNGKLWSAGVFASGDRLVNPSDSLNVSYTTSL